MTIPIYDQATLPLVVLPMDNTRAASSRYLANRAITGGITADINLKSASHVAVKALDDFWRDDCNYGLEPFILPLPIFGRSTDVNLLVRFDGDIKDSLTNGIWTIKRKLTILGLVVYTINANGDFILSDAGHFILDDNGDYIALTSQIHTYKEISYGIN